jgi:hypothetical protein
MTCKLVWIGLLLMGSVLSACMRNKPLARTPVATAPSLNSQGPAPEIENQATSDSFIVETLPEPATTVAEAPLNLTLPQQTPPPSQPKVVTESRREARPALQPPTETRPVAQAPPIQLLPQFSERDKAAMQKKIADQLDSARFLLNSLTESQLTEQQKPNVAAVNDFIRKSEDALKRGEFYQGLVLAQKANTLAASLARMP